MFENVDDVPCSRQLNWALMPYHEVVITNLEGSFEVCAGNEVSVWSLGVRLGIVCADEGGLL